jgi:phage RecT family recombinase
MATSKAALTAAPRDQLMALRGHLDKVMHACEPLLTPEIAHRLHAVVWQHIRTNPLLQKCSPASLYTAVHRMSQLRLDPSIPNECALVPFESQDRGYEVVLILGYGALRKMALEDPMVQDVYAERVCENDVYENAGPNTLPHHKFPEHFKPRGRTSGYYGVVIYTDGRVRCVQMSLDEVRAHRDRYSRAARSQFWEESTYTEGGLVKRKGGFDQMALKTVIRQLCNPKYVRLSPLALGLLTHESQVLHGGALGAGGGSVPHQMPPAGHRTQDAQTEDAGDPHVTIDELFGDRPGARRPPDTPIDEASSASADDAADHATQDSTQP